MRRRSVSIRRDPRNAGAWALRAYMQMVAKRETDAIADAQHAHAEICLMPSPDEKVTKNRLHLDLTPGPDGRDAEVERILALGATRVEIGQTGEESWTVLADPEGNEFCILRPKATLIA